MESVPYGVGLGIITYGYDGLLMVEARLERAASETIVLTPLGAESPLPDLDKIELHDEGLTLFCDDEESARRMVPEAVRASVKALYTTGSLERRSFFETCCGALLVIRLHHAQVVLPVGPEELDLELLDAGVDVIASLVRAAKSTTT